MPVKISGKMATLRKPRADKFKISPTDVGTKLSIGVLHGFIALVTGLAYSKRPNIDLAACFCLTQVKFLPLYLQSIRNLTPHHRNPL